MKEKTDERGRQRRDKIYVNIFKKKKKQEKLD